MIGRTLQLCTQAPTYARPLSNKNCHNMGAHVTGKPTVYFKQRLQNSYLCNEGQGSKVTICFTELLPTQSRGTHKS